MPTVTAIAGLPGSGKTELINREFRGRIQGICVEDFHAEARNNSPNVRDSQYYAELVKALRAGHDCVIADIAFTSPDRRAEVEGTISADVPGAVVEWVFFKNDLPQCIRNILGSIDTGRRWLDRIIFAIQFSTWYAIPDGATQRPVHPAYRIVRSELPPS